MQTITLSHFDANKRNTNAAKLKFLNTTINTKCIRTSVLSED
jgi:hypothetical protein